MVHHSIAVVITSFLTNFVESRLAELRRISLPRTPANRGFSPARIVDEQLTTKMRYLLRKAS
jgi:hypothetical protein